MSRPSDIPPEHADDILLDRERLSHVPFNPEHKQEIIDTAVAYRRFQLGLPPEGEEGPS